MGLWLIKERRLQHVADSAAYAVAMRSISVTDIVTLENLAIKVANLPNSPPELIAGEDTYTITISHSLPRQLTRIFNREEPDVTIRVRAVAKVFLGLADPLCLQALSEDPTKPAVSISGSSTINLRGCGIATNSPAADSFKLEGARAEIIGSCLYTVGGVDAANQLLTNPNCAEGQTLSPPTPDPYKELAMPSASDIQHLTRRRSEDINLMPYEELAAHPGLRAELFNSLTLDQSVELKPGLYIIDGGELRITSNVNITGKGISFYLMNGARTTLDGSVKLDISAANPDYSGPRTDPFAEFLFFADREGSSVSHTISGGADTKMNGVIYFQNDNLILNGASGATSLNIQIVASQIAVSGRGTVDICQPNMSCFNAGNESMNSRNAVIRLIE